MMRLCVTRLPACVLSTLMYAPLASDLGAFVIPPTYLSWRAGSAGSQKLLQGPRTRLLHAMNSLRAVRYESTVHVTSTPSQLFKIPTGHTLYVARTIAWPHFPFPP